MRCIHATICQIRVPDQETELSTEGYFLIFSAAFCVDTPSHINHVLTDTNDHKN